MRRIATSVVLLALLLAACGKRSAAPDQRTPQKAGPPPVCVVTETVRSRLLRDTTFAELVDLPPGQPPVRGVAAAISLLRSRYRTDLGRHEAVVRYLDRVGDVRASGKGALPTATEAVRRSARQLDRDLEGGLCDD